MIKFSPKKFEWKATVKKDLEYKISNTYNINIRAINSNTLNQNLTCAFMNASSRSTLIYKNIKINNNAIAHNTFSNIEVKDADFAFIKSHNCTHYDVDNSQEIDLFDYLDNHTNIWFGCEDAIALKSDYKMLMASTPTVFKLSSPLISKDVSIMTKYYFDLSTISLPAGVKSHNIFNTNLVPILILEYDNKGFVIISNYDMLDNPLNYEDMMYEVMMYIYLKSYKSTDWNKEWISYKLPDFEVINSKAINKTNFLSLRSIGSLLNMSESGLTLSKIDIRDDADKRTISSSDDDVSNTTAAIKCIGQNSGRLIFVLDSNIKMDSYTEIEKPAGWKAICANGHIYYLEKLHYLIESDIYDKISLMEYEDNLIVKVYNFKSSSCNINKESDTTIEVSFIKADVDRVQKIKEAEYTFSIKNNKISFCYKSDYIEEDNKFKLFDVIVSQTDEAITLYDMRQLGGGLSEEENDNFDLFDIGHINGRPYRKAGTLVLTMPTKYKEYESYIEKAVNKFKTAEDYIAIIFKDEEEE